MKNIYLEMRKIIKLVLPKLPSFGGVGGGLLLLILINIGANAQTVKVAAAANLRFVFEEIKISYEKANPGSKVMVNFGSSGALLQQILNGGDGQ